MRDEEQTIRNTLQCHFDCYCLKGFRKLLGTAEDINKIDNQFVHLIEDLVQLKQYLWEKLHSISWYQTEDIYRSLFGYCVLILAILEKKTFGTAGVCHKSIDIGILLSNGTAQKLLQQLLEELASNSDAVDFEFEGEEWQCQPVTMPFIGPNAQLIPRVTEPSLLTFYDEYFTQDRAVVITDSLAHWPALHRWCDLHYLSSVAGQRLVPIELGSSYLAEDAHSALLPLHTFLRDYIVRPGPGPRFGYLAQHDLLAQIPPLRQDIALPDYTCLTHPLDKEGEEQEVCNVWLGPVGTVSPLHFDCRHNLLAQAAGHKYLRLYRPDTTETLQPLGGRMCNNSTVDLLSSSSTTEEVRMLPYGECVLAPGEMLFLPRHHWHFVQALDTATALAWRNMHYGCAHHSSDSSTTNINDNNSSDNDKKHLQKVQFSMSVNFWWGPRLTPEELLVRQTLPQNSE